MARIIYSGLVTKISGSVGGTTFQGNKHGFTIKNKPNMTLPASVYQNEVKSFLSLAVTSWSSTSQVVRDRWNAWAIANPQYSKHNPSSALSGFEIFVRYHLIRFRYYKTINDNPTGGILAIPSFSPTVVASANHFQIFINASFGEYPLFMNTYVAVNIKESQNFVGSKPRFCSCIGPEAESFHSPNSWCESHGFHYYPGCILIVRFQVYNFDNGQVASNQDYRIVAP